MEKGRCFLMLFHLFPSLSVTSIDVCEILALPKYSPTQVQTQIPNPCLVLLAISLAPLPQSITTEEPRSQGHCQHVYQVTWAESCPTLWPGGDDGKKWTWWRCWNGRAKFITISLRSMINRGEISPLRPFAVSKFQETLVIAIATDFTCISRNRNSISSSWRQAETAYN